MCMCVFFFLIGNDRNIIKKKLQIKACTIEHYRIMSLWKKDKEEIKSVTFELEAKPQALDQSKRLEAKQSRSWQSVLDTSSNVRQLRSFQTIHIRHNWTRFQMSDECRPKPFHQLKSRSATFPESTQETP